MNVYVSYNQTFNNNAKLIYNGYYQPRFDQSNDCHIFQKAQISLAITDSINLIISLNHTYDSTPAVDVKESDFSQKVGISYKF